MSTEERNERILAELKQKLTMEQQTHLRTVLWLLSGDLHRRSGRTHLMCIAFIYEALEHPGRRIHVWDHVQGSSGYRQGQHVMHFIWELLEPFEELKVTWGDDGQWFSIAED